MTDAVLILGNGISRLAFHEDIEKYPGEVWGCNYVFREYPHKLTRLTGHKEPLEEAHKLRSEAGYKYDIYAGPLSHKLPDCIKFTVSPKWLMDSGTTLAAQALSEGKKIILCGFDLGGADVYEFNQYKCNKKNWVTRWAEIVKEWGSQSITFWGEDHLPYIQGVIDGTRKATEYSSIYMSRKPHIRHESYFSEWRKVVMEKKKIDESLVKVEYVQNGFVCEYKKPVADILLSKGVVRLFEEKKVEPKVEIKKEEKKPAKEKAEK